MSLSVSQTSAGLAPLEQGVVLIGGGGHAVVVAEGARLAGVAVHGFIDDNPAAPLAAILIDTPHPFLAPAHLGKFELLSTYFLTQGRVAHIAVGDVRLRRMLISNLPADVQTRARTIVHPRAIVSPTASIGPGCFVGPGAIVHSRAKVGAQCIINSGAIVEHDCIIGPNTHVAPGAVMGGSVRIGSDTLIGLGSRILPGVHVGSGCTIGAGAVVLAHVHDGQKVVGVPGRVVGS